MLKRFGLFLLTNLLVILTVSLILNFLLPALGIQLRGWEFLAVFCGVFGMAGAFVSLAISRWMAKRAYGIQLIDESTGHPELRALYHMTVRLSRKAGLPETPEVGVYESVDPNAFATGPSRRKSLIAYSTGLLQGMNEREVEAVAAHEISHIANGDMVTLTLLTGVMNALVMFLARVFAMVIDNFLSDDEGEGGLGYIGYIVVVFLLESVFMALASIPLAAFSRYREFRADAGSSHLTSPQSMIAALRSLQQTVEAPTQKDSLAMFKINSRRRVSLWSTHPPLEKRIARLEGK